MFVVLQNSFHLITVCIGWLIDFSLNNSETSVRTNKYSDCNI